MQTCVGAYTNLALVESLTHYNTCVARNAMKVLLAGRVIALVLFWCERQCYSALWCCMSVQDAFVCSCLSPPSPNRLTQ